MGWTSGGEAKGIRHRRQIKTYTPAYRSARWGQGRLSPTRNWYCKSPLPAGGRAGGGQPFCPLSWYSKTPLPAGGRALWHSTPCSQGGAQGGALPFFEILRWAFSPFRCPRGSAARFAAGALPPRGKDMLYNVDGLEVLLPSPRAAALVGGRHSCLGLLAPSLAQPRPLRWAPAAALALMVV